MFNQGEIGRIQAAINTSIARVARKCPAMKVDADDISQTAWLKVLTSYDVKRDMAQRTRRIYEAQDRITADANRGKYRTIKGQKAKWSNHVDRATCPEAFASVVAMHCALDWIKNSRGKYRTDNRHVSTEIEVYHSVDGVPLTLGDTLKSNLGNSVTAIEAGKRAKRIHDALAQLSAPELNAIRAHHEDTRPLSGAERIAKMRGMQKLQEMLPASL